MGEAPDLTRQRGIYLAHDTFGRECAVTRVQTIQVPRSAHYDYSAVPRDEPHMQSVDEKCIAYCIAL